MDAVKIDEKINYVEEILKKLEKDDIAIEECKNKIDMIEKEVLKINPDGSTSPLDDADF